jgi:hypothetical protein
MMTRDRNALRGGGAAAVVGLCLLLGLAGCNLTNVSIPGLEGPSELGISLKLTVNPDVISADGFSTALIQAEVKGPDGRPLANVDIFFALADEDGNFADLGTLSHNRGVTNGSGIAQVIYTAPPRTDATANQTLLILARPVSNDANAAVYRQVRLELRSPEPKLFPQVPNNGDPTCQFIVETPDGFHSGVDILFQDTSFDSDGTIVRYYWDFGDGSIDDKPDVAHRYGTAGTYTVNHLVTDDDGGQTLCTPLTFTVD